MYCIPISTPLTGVGDCINITTSDVSLDCQDNSIQYGSLGPAVGIKAKNIYNVTIINCNITNVNNPNSFSHGINFTNVNESYILDTTITVDGDSSIGIHFRNLVENTIANSTITTIGTGSDKHAIFLLNARKNVVEDNTVTTNGVNGNTGIFVRNGSIYNFISNNIITTQGSGVNVYGIHLWQSNNNNITNCTISSTASTSDGYGILINNANSTRIRNNTITTHGASNNNGIVFQNDAALATVSGNSIATDGTSTSHGIVELTPCERNTITNNNISTRGTNSYGLYSTTNAAFTNTVLNSPSEWIYTAPATSNNFTNTTFITLNGQLNFANKINTSDGLDMTTSRFNILGSGKIMLNSSNLTFFNVSSNLTIPNIPITNPQITIDINDNGTFAPCSPSLCQKTYQDNSMVKFNVAHFTTYGVQDIGACGDLTGNVKLTNDVNSAGTCFDVISDDVTIDCDGYEINYSQSAAGSAINVDGYNNITIKNCNITSGAQSDSFGVNLTDALNITIANNNITLGNNDNTRGIKATDCTNVTVKNNAFSIRGVGESRFAIDIAASTGTYTPSGAVISDNTITGMDEAGSGIIFGSTDEAIVQRNVMDLNGIRSHYGIHLGAVSDNNIISDNNISMTAGSGDQALLVSQSHDNSIRNNKIGISGGTGTTAIRIETDSNNNSFNNNNITANGAGTYAIYATHSNSTFNNTVLNNPTGWIFNDASTNTTLHNTTFIGTGGNTRYPGQLNALGSFDVTRTAFNVSANLTYLDSGTITFMNTSARVDLKGIELANPIIVVDKQDTGWFRRCLFDTCAPVGYGGPGTPFVFDVTHFTGYSVLQDYDAPNITLVGPAYGFNTSQTSPQFRWNVTDDIEYNVSCTNSILYPDGSNMGIVQNSTTFEISTESSWIFADGHYGWLVSCTDGSGNSAANPGVGVYRPFTIDTVAPNLTFIFPLNQTYTSNISPTFNFSAIDNLFTQLNYSITVDQVVNATGIVTNNTNASRMLINLTEGRKNITIWVSDAAGNTGNITRIITIDTSPPSISRFVLTPETVGKGGTIDAACLASDALSGVDTYITGVDTSVSGSYTATCTATDGASNRATATATYTVTQRYAGSSGGGGSGGGTIVKPINQQYDQIEAGLFSFKITSSDYPITALQVDTKEKGNNVQFTIRKTAGMPLGTNNPPGRTYFFFTIDHLNLPPVNWAEITFKIEESWLKANNVGSQQASVYRWENSRWREYPAQYRGTLGGIQTFNVRLPGLSPFAIAAGSTAGPAPAAEQPAAAAQQQAPSVPAAQTETKPAQETQKPAQAPAAAQTAKSNTSLALVIAGLVITAVVAFAYFKKRHPPHPPGEEPPESRETHQPGQTTQEAVRTPEQLESDLDLLNDLLGRGKQ